MKKIIFLFLLGFLFFSLSAQEEVVFKFSRENVRVGRKLDMPVYVNGKLAGKLRNGDSLVYKAMLDLIQPVAVSVKYGGSKRVITVYPKAEKKVAFEASLAGSFLRFDLVSGAALKPGTGTVASGNINKTNLAISYVSTTTHATDTIRQQWVEKGGRMEGFSRGGAISITSMKSPGMKMSGGGLQFTMTSTFLNMKIPERKPGIQTWNSWVYGYSFNELFSVSSTKMEIEGMDPMTSGSASIQLMLSGNGGYTIGAGKFRNDTKWKGVAFEITYRPSIIFVLPMGEGGIGDIDVQVNMTGFGLDLNFNSFTSNAIRLAPKAQSKFTFFMLPPIKKLPLIITVGYGRTMYRKIYPPSPTSGRRK